MRSVAWERSVITCKKTVPRIGDEENRAVMSFSYSCEVFLEVSDIRDDL